jgi:5-methylcytosine-specific restriction endonuclease McrA
MGELIAILITVAILVIYDRRARKRERLISEAKQAAKRLSNLVSSSFLVQPCPRCHECGMRLLDVSPNARSVHYECLHCQKRMRAPAGSAKASEVLALRDQLEQIRASLNAVLRNESAEFSVQFETVAAPLPFEQTRREPIPESIKTEIWRRDGGVCVKCGSNENLQFDHIIPVSRGGATSSQNLQLLRKQCNLEKATKI